MNEENKSWFGRFAKKASCYAGRPVTFGVAIAGIVLWAATGPLLGFSDTWQLMVNTTTTIVTFLMVFLIQNSQNRDSEALQIKLDELIRVQKKADNAFMDLEDLSEEQLDKVRADFVRLAEEKRGKDGASDSKNPKNRAASL
jgi:low affinity Fe/Cu permease